MQFDLLQNDLFSEEQTDAQAHIRKPSKPTMTTLAEVKPQPAEDKPLPESLVQAARAYVGPMAEDAERHSATAEKSPDAMKTISEAAEVLGVPQHVLRFWESRFAQLKPVKSRGGRRYYRPEDMETLLSIKQLLYNEGYTIKGAKKALSSPKREENSLSEAVEDSGQQQLARALEALPKRAQLSAQQVQGISQLRQELIGLREELKSYL